MRAKILIISFLLFPVFLLAEPSSPILVEGSYSTTAPLSSDVERQKADVLASSLKEIGQKIQTKKYQTAISIAKELMDNGFNDPRLYVALAYSYEQLEDCDDAIYYASQAIAKMPSSVEAYTTRANCYFKKNDNMRAAQDIEIAIALNPKALRAAEVKKVIYTNPLTPRKKALAKGYSGIFGNMPSWFLVYVICVVAIFVVWIIIRYRKPEYIDDKGRKLKEYNIKEQYNFIRAIGEGGMGRVYEAYDNALKRKVAVKRIKPELLKSDYIREQFLSEARMVAMLRHPSIVEIYTVIETTSSLYLVFEYVDGQTLETRLDIDNYIPFDEVKDIFRSVCAGLSYAHSQDIVHCDLKPGNIMISDSGIAKVMDFGVAQKIIKGKKNDSFTVAGTPAYMSPEQQKGVMSKQSDIYSLGVCLYEALIGVVPWTVKGYDLNTKKIVPPSSIIPSLGTDIDNLLIRALEQNPAKRIQTVEEFWTLLDSCEVGQHTSTK